MKEIPCMLILPRKIYQKISRAREKFQDKQFTHSQNGHALLLDVFHGVGLRTLSHDK
jgi:hypothetical protein